MKAELLFLGTSAEFPLPRTITNKFKDYLDIENYQRKFKLHNDRVCNSAKKGGKDKRTRSSFLLIFKNSLGAKHLSNSILFECGPDILYHLKKYKLSQPDAIFITHNHPDASYGLKYISNKIPVYGEEVGNIRIEPNKAIKIFNIEILPFRVRHSKLVKSVGYRIKLNKRNIVYLGDISTFAGIKRYLKKADLIISDGSILKRNLNVHKSMINQLIIFNKWFKRKKPKVIFTHIGHSIIPDIKDKKVESIHNKLVKYLKGIYKQVDIAYDGRAVEIKN